MDIKSELGKYLGSISDEEKDAVYKEISGGSHPTNEFFIMLVISAIIATIGLLTNSVAVIIGAMLVSPFLIPVIGISLGAVRGDVALFRRAIEAESKGILLVIALVILLTLLIPNASITSEILLRTHPTPLDLVVALASGAAAAYALSKKSIGAALPGVAIAVAVMPPLSVVGIGFALRRPEVAIGGLLTFLANVVAINFAASAVFWLMNFSPKISLTAEKETMSRLKTSAVLLLIIPLPLAWIMWGSVNTDSRSGRRGFRTQRRHIAQRVLGPAHRVVLGIGAAFARADPWVGLDQLPAGEHFHRGAVGADLDALTDQLSGHRIEAAGYLDVKITGHFRCREDRHVVTSGRDRQQFRLLLLDEQLRRALRGRAMNTQTRRRGAPHLNAALGIGKVHKLLACEEVAPHILDDPLDPRLVTVIPSSG